MPREGMDRLLREAWGECRCMLAAKRRDGADLSGLAEVLGGPGHVELDSEARGRTGSDRCWRSLSSSDAQSAGGAAATGQAMARKALEYGGDTVSGDITTLDEERSKGSETARFGQG